MTRWRWALLPVLLCSVLIVLWRPSGKGALADTDTAYLLDIIRSNPDPVSHKPQSILNWFVGDWPLHNHFYRPISTLTFEMDTRLHGNDGSGYVLTNALIAALCILALFWFLKELTDNVWLTGSATLLFGLWNLGVVIPDWLGWAWAPVLLFGLVRNGLRIGPALLAAGATAYFFVELQGKLLDSAVISWIPGRTTSVMTLFCLIAMASYARFARATSPRILREATPLDPPATRNTQVASKSMAMPWLWLIVAVIATYCAFGSHEQAVMLPGAIVGVAVSLRLQRYQVRWGWAFGFLLLLGGYLLLRHAVLPPGVSQYQRQQIRTGNGTWGALLGYVMPDVLQPFSVILGSFDLPIYFWLGAVPYVALWAMFTDVAAFFVARRRWVMILTGWALSILAFLPMAWVKPFPHYDYWPMAMRSLFVVALGAAVWEAVISAWSPRAIRLPARLAPAPGSLPVSDL